MQFLDHKSTIYHDQFDTALAELFDDKWVGTTIDKSDPSDFLRTKDMWLAAHRAIGIMNSDNDLVAISGTWRKIGYPRELVLFVREPFRGQGYGYQLAIQTIDTFKVGVIAVDKRNESSIKIFNKLELPGSSPIDENFVAYRTMYFYKPTFHYKGHNFVVLGRRLGNLLECKKILGGSATAIKGYENDTFDINQLSKHSPNIPDIISALEA